MLIIMLQTALLRVQTMPILIAIDIAASGAHRSTIIRSNEISIGRSNGLLFCGEARFATVGVATQQLGAQHQSMEAAHVVIYPG